MGAKNARLNGDGQTAKVANQIIVAENIEAVAEGPFAMVRALETLANFEIGEQAA